jgi:adenosylmethionine-8-amino-7-oxononanoate aminotransferase
MSILRVNETVFRSHLLHRSLFDEPQKVVSGSGISLTLESGEVIIDASSGPGVACLGHNQPAVTEAVAAQMNQIAYLHFGSKYSNAPAEELASLLLSHKPGGLVRAFFVTSGSEATDAALKLATQYWHEKGQFQRNKFISRKQSFHGNTLGALNISGHQTRREYYKDWFSKNVSFVDPCYAYRAQWENETDVQYVTRLRQQLEDEIQRLGPDTVAAFVAETVSGSVLGCAPAVPGYFKAVREVCDKYGILLILDEVSQIGPRQCKHKQNLADNRGSRSCVAWGKLGQCMHGNKKIYTVRTSRLLARLLERDSCHYLESS